MDKTTPRRARGFFSLGTNFLFLAFAILLTACGGGATSSDGATSGADGNSATLAWDPPATGANLAGYRVYVGTEPGNYLQPFGQGIDIGNVTTYTLMGLNSGMRYYFTVTTVDNAGNESVFSNEVFKDIP